MSSVAVVLGGLIIADPSHPRKFRTTTLEDTDCPFGLFGDNLRGKAAAQLYRQNMIDKIIIIGGVTPLHRTCPDAPNLALIVEQEIAEENIPLSNIKTFEISPETGTFEQLICLQRILRNDTGLGLGHMYIISNFYHLPRVWAMILFRSELLPLCAHLWSWYMRIRLASAEEILMNADEGWREKIMHAYQTPQMQACLKKEFDGVHLLAGNAYTLPQGFPQR